MFYCYLNIKIQIMSKYTPIFTLFSLKIFGTRKLSVYREGFNDELVVF